MIGPLVAADAARAAALLAAAGLPGWDAASLQDELARAGCVAIAAQDDGGLSGVLVGRAVLDELEIHAVAVDAARRRRGLGRALVTGALAAAAARGVTRAFLEVRSGNGAARALYRALGFEELAVRPRYYADGEDAIQLGCGLAPR